MQGKVKFNIAPSRSARVVRYSGSACFVYMWILILLITARYTCHVFSTQFSALWITFCIIYAAQASDLRTYE